MKGTMITQRGVNQTHCALSCQMSLLKKERREMTIFCSLLLMFCLMKELLGVKAAPHRPLVKFYLSQISLWPFPRGRNHKTKMQAFLHTQQHGDLTWVDKFLPRALLTSFQKGLLSRQSMIKNITGGVKLMTINLTETKEDHGSAIIAADQVTGVVTAQGVRLCKYKTIIKLILEHFLIHMPCSDLITLWVNWIINKFLLQNKKSLYLPCNEGKLVIFIKCVNVVQQSTVTKYQTAKRIKREVSHLL